MNMPKTTTKLKKLFVVRKYIWATNAEDAIRADKLHKPDDVWVDETWKANQQTPKNAIGFNEDV